MLLQDLFTKARNSERPIVQAFWDIVAQWRLSKRDFFDVSIATVCINLLALVFPLTLLQIYDRIIPNQATTTLSLLTVGVLSAVLLESIFRLARAYLTAWSDAKTEHQNSCEAFNRIMHSHYESFEKDGPGRHLERMSALSAFRELYMGQALVTMIDVPFLCLYLLLIAYIGGWVVFVPLALLAGFLVVNILIGDKLHILLDKKRLQDDRRVNYMIELLTKIHAVKATALEAQMLRRYERLLLNSSPYNYHLFQLQARTNAANTLVSQLSIILIVGFGSLLVMDGAMTVGGLVACTLLSGRCIQPMMHAIKLWQRLQTIQTAKDKIAEMHNMAQEQDEAQAKVQHIQGDIDLKEVILAEGLSPVTLHIPANKMIAVESEASQVQNQLMMGIMGIRRLPAGRIYIDGRDVCSMDPDSLRKHIAYLPERTELFKGTLLENLALFQPEKYNVAKKLARKLGLAPVIEKLEKGYDTPIGKQSQDAIPQGLRQMIGIIRALVEQPRIILFDEPNQSLDMRSDAHVKHMLSQIKGQYTIILVSHRPSILSLADEIYTLDGKGDRQRA